MILNDIVVIFGFGMIGALEGGRKQAEGGASRRPKASPPGGTTMKTTLNWFDKMMIAVSFAEENAYQECLAPKNGKQKAATPSSHLAGPHGLGEGLHPTKA